MFILVLSKSLPLGLAALFIAFWSGVLSGELLTLYCILVGVVDLLLVSIGRLGLFEPLII